MPQWQLDFKGIKRQGFLSLSKACCLSFLAFVMLEPFPSMSVWSQNDAIKSCSIYKKDKNGCFILDFLGSDLSKMDQTWSNLLKLDFSTIKKCFYTKLSHLQIGWKWPFYFGSDWIRSVQNELNLTKLVQIGSKKIRINQIDKMFQIR